MSVLLGILVAGLVPFRRPRNDVTWLGNQNGLRFGRYATVLSSGTFQVAAVHHEPSCSLEIWLQPSVMNVSTTLLAFSTSENPLQLWVHQYHAVLILQRVIRGAEDRTQRIAIDHVFGQIKPVFIAITSGAQKTSMYIDGNLAKSFPRFRIENDCTGQLVIGTSPLEMIKGGPANYADSRFTNGNSARRRFCNTMKSGRLRGGRRFLKTKMQWRFTCSMNVPGTSFITLSVLESIYTFRIVTHSCIRDSWNPSGRSSSLIGAIGATS